MKVLGVVGGLFVLAVLTGGLSIVDVAGGIIGGTIGLVAGLFGMLIGLGAGLFGAMIGIAAGLFGAVVAVAVVFVTVVLPFLLIAAICLGVAKLLALA
jgi:hypothetical protein